jgi:DNA repair protein RecO (recombination protein O)
MVRSGLRRSASPPLGTEALVLRRIPYGETDLVVQFATRELGRISTFARAARRSRRRFPSGFPSFSLLEIHVGPPPHPDAMRPLLDATLLRADHPAIAADLGKFASAGLLAEVAREAMAEGHVEPTAFDALARGFAELAERPFDPAGLPDAQLRLLAPLGLAPSLARCVACDAAAPAGRSAFFDPARGGIVCRRCGGAAFTLAGPLRERWMRAAAGEASVPGGACARPGAVREAQRALRAFLEHQFGRRFKSGRLLDEALAPESG